MLAELARADAGGFTFVELSRLLLVTSGNLTGIVDRLEQQQLVERRPDAKDRRVIRVALTDKGRRVTDEVLPAHAADIDEILSFMPRAALMQLSDLLGRLRDGLHARADRDRAGARAQASAAAAAGRMMASVPHEHDRCDTSPSAGATEEGLHRGLTQRQLTMIAIGSAIGVGLFLGSTVHHRPRRSRRHRHLSCIGAVIALIMAYALAEMAVVHPLGRLVRRLRGALPLAVARLRRPRHLRVHSDSGHRRRGDRGRDLLRVLVPGCRAVGLGRRGVARSACSSTRRKSAGSASSSTGSR